MRSSSDPAGAGVTRLTGAREFARADNAAASATDRITPFRTPASADIDIVPEYPTLGTWLTVDADVIADDPELTEWLRRGLRGIRP